MTVIYWSLWGGGEGLCSRSPRKGWMQSGGGAPPEPRMRHGAQSRPEVLRTLIVAPRIIHTLGIPKGIEFRRRVGRVECVRTRPSGSDVEGLEERNIRAAKRLVSARGGGGGRAHQVRRKNGTHLLSVTGDNELGTRHSNVVKVLLSRSPSEMWHLSPPTDEAVAIGSTSKSPQVDVRPA